MRAVAVATRKKGGSIKVMPIAAVDPEAFKALIVDLPSLLEDKGRKAYLHISPDPNQVEILQESGWLFEAQIPEAYSRHSVVQQWGCPLGRDAQMKSLRIHSGYLRLIEIGQKTLEIRVGYDHIKTIAPGADICLVSRDRQLRCHVSAVRRYPNFVKMLQQEDVDRALPGLSTAEALARLRQIYPATKERLGVVVLQLDPQSADVVHT
jgi:ASC-1-like (ASCH) protein